MDNYKKKPIFNLEATLKLNEVSRDDIAELLQDVLVLRIPFDFTSHSGVKIAKNLGLSKQQFKDYSNANVSRRYHENNFFPILLKLLNSVYMGSLPVEYFEVIRRFLNISKKHASKTSADIEDYKVIEERIFEVLNHHQYTDQDIDCFLRLMFDDRFPVDFSTPRTFKPLFNLLYGCGFINERGGFYTLGQFNDRSPHVGGILISRLKNYITSLTDSKLAAIERVADKFACEEVASEDMDDIFKQAKKLLKLIDDSATKAKGLPTKERLAIGVTLSIAGLFEGIPQNRGFNSCDVLDYDSPEGKAMLEAVNNSAKAAKKAA